ncbi:putative AMP-binding enzyme C-terminal domain [Lyophyllum shimeji]|uniref:AMP-binding enzyme C-terminal domain n=1 Tax=Lyophyllum shimeji TaxID=47721 RepID=A0A9P3PNM8_LYOSH|nr:putative AMP-binding enzyme C-terminal domain [Lyophyllum shimeji]
MYVKSAFPDVPAYPEVNAHHIFFNRPDQADWPDYTFLIDAKTGKKRGFREFVQRVRAGATALGSPSADGGLGLRGEDGEIVGIIHHNSMDYITIVHSLLAITTPFVLISSYSTPFELKHALELSKATRLFVSTRLLPLVLPVAKTVGIPSSKIYILEGRVKGRKSFAEMIEGVERRKMPILQPRHATKDTLAYLIFSSGTSGLPKAVMISHGNIIYSIGQVVVMGAALAEVYTPPRINTPEGIPIGLAFLPLHHSYGLHAYSFRAFLSPLTLVLMSRWDLKHALELIPKYKITSVALIPSVVHQLVNYPGIDKVDLSSIQSMGSGAAYLPPELAAKLQALIPQSANFTEGYGMSEATIAAITQPYPGLLNGRYKKVVGSTGVLLPGMEAKILRDDGTDADVNEVGELYLRSGNIALGYWNNEKATGETFVDGWLRTGDKFRVDEEGYFFFADRAKDTLKVSGIQVSPVEIENVLLAEPQHLITDATVAGVSGGRTSDEKVPRAWVVLSDAGKKLGGAATIKELERWHQEHLSKYKWLRGGIEVVKEIPKSPTGKVLRRTLQDRYERHVAKRPKGKL